MAAAEITPTFVQKKEVVYDVATGTPVPVVEYLIYGTKATQNDWILHDTYTPGTFMYAYGGTIDSSSDGAAETVTYDDSEDKIVLAGATTGTFYLKVVCKDDSQ